MDRSSWVAAAFASEKGARAALRYMLGAGLEPISTQIRPAPDDSPGGLTVLDLEVRPEDVERFGTLAKGAHGVVVPGRKPEDGSLDVVA